MKRRKVQYSKWTLARDNEKNKTQKEAETLSTAHKQMNQTYKNKTTRDKTKTKIKTKLTKRISSQKAAETPLAGNF